MKKAIKHIGCIFLLFGALPLLGYAQGKKETGFENEPNVIEPNTFENGDAPFFLKNKDLIRTFYDEIAYEIIDIILLKRVYGQNPEKRTILKNFPLDSFSKKLIKEDEKKVKFYTDTLVKFKNNLINSLTSNTVYNKFKGANDSLFASPFFLETLLAGKKEDSIYADLVNTIKRKQSETEVAIKKNIEKANELFHKRGGNIQNDDAIKKPNQIAEGHSYSRFLINFKWWLFGLLMGSLLLNLFQYFRSRKKRDDYKKEVSRKNRINHTNNYTHKYFQADPSTLSTSIIKIEIEQIYVQLRQLLSNRYHRDCIASVSKKIDSLQLDTISEANSKSFKDKEELLRFLNSKVENHKSILSNELENYVTKEYAKQSIDNCFSAQNFSHIINVNIVSEEDIQNKIQQLKKAVISELPKVISKPQLTTTLEKLNKDISRVLQKMAQDNLVYYFAFADAKGTLNDTKKSRTIERDSAIQLSVNPEDTAKATFKLLLEKEDMMKAGIMSYDSFLVPICELTSENFNSTGTQIEQIGPDGKMELENGIWKVKNKLAIKVI